MMSKSDTFQGPGGFLTPSNQNPNPANPKRHAYKDTQKGYKTTAQTGRERDREEENTEKGEGGARRKGKERED